MTLNWDLDSDRRQAYDSSHRNAAILHRWLVDPSGVPDDELGMLGLLPAPRRAELRDRRRAPGTLGPIEVHSVRPVRRIGPDDRTRSAARRRDHANVVGRPGTSSFRGGVTLIVDMVEAKVLYVVRKRVDSAARFYAQQGLMPAGADAMQGSEETSLHDNYYDSRDVGREPFAMLHRSSASMVT